MAFCEIPTVVDNTLGGDELELDIRCEVIVAAFCEIPAVVEDALVDVGDEMALDN